MNFTLFLLLTCFVIKSSLATCPPSCKCTKTYQIYDVRCILQTKLPIMPLEISTRTNEMELELNRTFSLESMSFRHFNRLEKLTIISSGYTLKVNNAAFVALNKLTRLNLLGANLAIIDSYSLSGLCGLNELSITGFKNLTALPDDVFASLKNLKRLNISNNALMSIQRNSFNDLDALVYINLSNNNLTLLDPNLFKGMPHLLELQMNSNRLLSIEEGLFLHTKNLVYLSVVGNHLLTVNDNVFQSLAKLVYLDLHKNRITSMSTTALSALRQLEYLYIHKNRLECTCDLKYSLHRLNKLKELGADCLLDDEVVDLNDLECSALEQPEGHWVKRHTLNEKSTSMSIEASKDPFQRDFAISLDAKVLNDIDNDLTVRMNPLSLMMTSQRNDRNITTHGYNNTIQIVLDHDGSTSYCFCVAIKNGVWNTIKIIQKSDVIYVNITSQEPITLREYLSTVNDNYTKLFRKVKQHSCTQSKSVLFKEGLIKNMALYRRRDRKGVVKNDVAQKEQCRVVLVKWEKVIVLMSAALALLVIIFLVIKCLYSCHGRRNADTRPRPVNTNNSSI